MGIKTYTHTHIDSSQEFDCPRSSYTFFFYLRESSRIGSYHLKPNTHTHTQYTHTDTTIF